ncbi:MBL fold metallo-hydrolase, partial (plasmid) [Clostridium perfringens]
MSIIKSFSVGNGDMFYIRHGSDNFTVIDCYLNDENTNDEIIDEIKKESEDKGIKRFISTHPDEDHIKGIKILDEKWEIINFYCVENKATKDEPSEDFKKYCELRDSSKKAFYIEKGCSRNWMNQSSNERGS